MTAPFDLQEHGMLGLTKTSFDALRAALLRDGLAGATALQDAGYAGGEAMYAAFAAWLAERGDAEAAELTVEEFGRQASAFFGANGWGSFTVGSLHEALATVDSTDWLEADPAAALPHPGCHLTTGMLAGFFGGAGSVPLAALEVECRSAGHDRCRFLVGSGAVLTHLFEAMERGAGYDDAARALAPAAAGT